MNLRTSWRSASGLALVTSVLALAPSGALAQNPLVPADTPPAAADPTSPSADPTSDPTQPAPGTADTGAGANQGSDSSPAGDPTSAGDTSSDPSDPSSAPDALDPALPGDGPAGSPGSGSRPVAPVLNGITLRFGRAHLIRKAPQIIRQAVRAANHLQNKPYRYGGGHAHFADSAYDCSGSVSYVLHAAGLLQSPLDSRGLAHWGLPGPGRWITIYANHGHAFMFIAGLRLDTSGQGASGPRWRTDQRSLGAFRVRHPPGL